MHREGNLLVLAGPGSGKTTVLLNRLKYLIEQRGEPPEVFLVITFTKAAARSMEERFLSASQQTYPVTFSTFHSFFYQILKRHTGIGPENFLSAAEKENLLLPILKQFQNHESPAVWLERFGKYQNTGETFSGIDFFAQVYQEYQKKIKQQNKTDYDEMARQCLELFEKNPEALQLWRKRFRHILIDEFQDINRCQYAVLRKLAGKCSSFFAVGDDDQSIYGFRGSSPSIMREYLTDFKPVSQIVLCRNYRSDSSIVASSRKVISQNKNRIAKELQAAKVTDRQTVHIYGLSQKDDEYDFVAKALEGCGKNSPKQEKAAIILRTNAALWEWEMELKKRGILCQRQGEQTVMAEHFIVRDILAYLYFAKGERKRSLFLQIRNKPDRGISREALEEETICFAKLEAFYESKPQIRETVLQLEADLETLCRLPVFLAINYIRKKMGYDNYLKDKAGERGKEMVSERMEYCRIADALQDYGKQYPDLEQFCANLKIDWGRTKETGSAGVKILTMHMAKGLEFDRVFLPDCNEGIIPMGRNLSMAELEEERRLFYVAMTRAKKALDILYLTGTKESPRLPSQFLKPIL